MRSTGRWAVCFSIIGDALHESAYALCQGGLLILTACCGCLDVLLLDLRFSSPLVPVGCPVLVLFSVSPAPTPPFERSAWFLGLATLAAPSESGGGQPGVDGEVARPTCRRPFRRGLVAPWCPRWGRGVARLGVWVAAARGRGPQARAPPRASWCGVRPIGALPLGLCSLLLAGRSMLPRGLSSPGSGLVSRALLARAPNPP